MNRIAITAATLALIGATSLAPAFAAPKGGASSGAQTGTASNTSATAPTTMNGPSSTGQPKQTCGSASAPTTPGQASSAPGSAFNPNGQAGSVYAGQQTQNSRNTASSSQYDVACSHQP
jgi:hypothetical protein